MLQLESTIHQISSRKFSHDPETYVLHDQLQNLVSVEAQDPMISTSVMTSMSTALKHYH